MNRARAIAFSAEERAARRRLFGLAIIAAALLGAAAGLVDTGRFL